MSGQGTGWQPGVIVVGYDGTASAELALRRTAEIAAPLGSLVVVADVAAPDPVPALPGAFGLGAYDYIDTSAQIRRTDDSLWREHREQVAALLRGRGVKFEFATAIGEPVGELVDLAATRSADLIVVGSRELGFLERLVGGSVSQGVARRASCDVLIVRSPEDTTPAP